MLAFQPTQRVYNLCSKAKKATDLLVSTVFNLEGGDGDKVQWLHDGLRYIYPHSYEVCLSLSSRGAVLKMVFRIILWMVRRHTASQSFIRSFIVHTSTSLEASASQSWTNLNHHTQKSRMRRRSHQRFWHLLQQGCVNATTYYPLSTLMLFRYLPLLRITGSHIARQATSRAVSLSRRTSQIWMFCQRSNQTTLALIIG